MPGLIVQGLKKVGVSNPVILLDEIDKVGYVFESSNGMMLEVNNCPTEPQIITEIHQPLC